MLRTVFLSLCCLLLAACGGSTDSDSSTADVADNSLNPSAMAVETPPGNGKLPADLYPPQ